jgi:hypothetical protein
MEYKKPSEQVIDFANNSYGALGNIKWWIENKPEDMHDTILCKLSSVIKYLQEFSKNNLEEQ